jgi:tetratricopeptide (TPR) repeat protein
MEQKKDIVKTITRLAENGDWINVIKEYEKLLKLDPNDISIYNSMGDAYAKLGEDRKAFECYLKVMDDYQKKGNLTKISFLHKKIAKLNPRKFDLESKALHEKILKGVQAQTVYDKGDVENAIPALKEAVKMDQTNPELFIKLGEACEKKTLIGDAVEAYTKAIRIYIGKNKIDDAVNVANKILAIDKTNVEATAIIAEDLIKKGEKQKAEEIFKDIFINLAEKNAFATGVEIAKRAMDLNVPYGKQFYAYFLFKNNKIDDAKKVLENSYELNNEEKILLGKIYFKSNDFSRSKEIILSMDTEIITENEEIQELIADIYVKLYDYKKAMEYYIKVLKLYIEKEMYDNALVIVNKILNVDKENINAYEAMAQIYIKKGMKNNLIDAYTKLSIIYEKIGEKEKAAEKRALLQKLKML